MKSTEDLRAELAQAEKREREEKDALRAATPVEWEFTLLPDTRDNDRVYDSSCRLYRLEGRIINKEEASAVGHMVSHSEGGMTYVFNSLSERLVMPVGGGTIFISRTYGPTASKSDVIAMNELSQFLVAHPDGGDVTEIVTRHKARRVEEQE